MKFTQENGDVASDTRADSARVDMKYATLNSDATKAKFEELNAVLCDLAEQVIHTLDQVVPHLSKMQALLSQRGKARKHILKQAGLPSWTKYANEYAKKLNCKMRTIQDHITGFRRNGKAGATRQKKSKLPTKPLSLGARQQSALVEAQLAANEIVVALKSGGDWEAAVAAYDIVAVAPDRLDSFVNTLSPAPDYKQMLVDLMDLLEQYGEKLPVAVLNKKRFIETILNGKAPTQLVCESQAQSAKKYQKVRRQDSEGKTRWVVKTKGEKAAWGDFETESAADEAIEHLNSPAVSLTATNAVPKIPPASVALDGAGNTELQDESA